MKSRSFLFWGLTGLVVSSLSLADALRCPNGAFPAERCEQVRNEALRVGCIDQATFDRLRSENRFPACVGAVNVGDCPCGCFAPEALLDVLNAGRSTVVSALNLFTADRGTTLLALASDARLSNPNYESSLIANRTIGEEKVPLVRVETTDGRILRITEKHPVLKADGKMVTARELTRSDELVNRDGSHAKIRRLTRETSPDSVYNFQTSGTTLASHVIVAEGLLVGDLAWQNTLEQELTGISLRK